MAEMDEDGNNEVTFKEFEAWFEQNGGKAVAKSQAAGEVRARFSPRASPFTLLSLPFGSRCAPMRARQLPSSRQVAIGPMKAGDIRATPVGKVRRTTCSSREGRADLLWRHKSVSS